MILLTFISLYFFISFMFPMPTHEQYPTYFLLKRKLHVVSLRSVIYINSNVENMITNFNLCYSL